MRPILRPAFVAAGLPLLFALGCMVDRSERTGYALDYHLDRPRVLAIAVDPPVFVHGQPVTVHSLALGPDGAVPDAISVDVCGLRTDQVVSVWELDCFGNEALVTHLGDGPEVAWEPPDLSGLGCPEPWPDSGEPLPDDGPPADTGVPDPDPDTDPPPPSYDYECGSDVPLLVTATFGRTPAFASTRTEVRLEPLAAGEFVPSGRYAAARSLTWTGDAVAGGEVVLTFTIAAESSRFSWFVDGGELAGTGWTADFDPDPHDEQSLTRNTLRIPADWHGPLRVVAVAVDQEWTYGVAGDSGWSVITLEVP